MPARDARGRNVPYKLPAAKPKAKALFPVKRVAPIPALAPVDFHNAQRQAHAKVRKAENAAVKSGAGPTIPHPNFPTLPHYTPAQRTTIKKAWRKARQAEPDQLAAGKEFTRVTTANVADRDTRRQFHKLQGLLATDSREHAIASGRGLAKQVGVTQKIPRAKAYELGNAILAQKDLESTGINALGAAKPKKAKKKGPLPQAKIAGIPIPGVQQLLHPAQSVNDALHALTAPAHAISGAANAAMEHPGDVKALVKGAAENVKTGKHNFGEVLRNKGFSRTAALVGGTALDIATDPLNLATAGAAPVAEQLARQSLRATKIGEDLHAAGKTAKAAKYFDQAAKLAEKSDRAPANRGVQLRLGTRKHGISTSGKATAKLNRALGGSAIAGRIHDAPKIQAVTRRLNADVRPAGVTRSEWQNWLTHSRRARAMTAQSQHSGTNLGRALNTMLDGHSHDKVVNVLEGIAHPNTLNDAEREVAVGLKGLHGALAKHEIERGLLAPISDVEHYFPHVLSKEAREAYSKNRRFGPGKKTNPFGMRRKDPRPISEVNADVPGDAQKFTTNVGHAEAERFAKSGVLTAHRQLADDVVRDISKPFNGVGDMRGGDAIYVYSPKDGLKPLSTDHIIPNDAELKKARKGLNKKSKERLVVIDRSIGDRAIEGVLPGARVSGRDLLPSEHGAEVGFDRVNGKVKSALTTFNAPSYQLRNFLGDAWNGRLAGTTTGEVRTGLRIANLRRLRNKHSRTTLAKFEHDFQVNIGHGRKISAQQLLKDMEQRGVIGGGFAGRDLRDDTHMAGGQFVDPKRFAAGPHPVEALHNATQFGEDSNRIATYLGALRRAMTEDEAATHALAHHFDYGNLTDTEKRVFKRAFPFWTFTARNTPLQAKSLVKRPSQFANYGLAQEESSDQAGLPRDWYKRAPGYLQRQLPLAANVKGHRVIASPQWPLNDLNRVQSLTDPAEFARETGQMIHPFAKLAGEPLLNYSLFFRGPLYQDKDHPTAPHYVNAPWFVKKLPAAARTALAGGSQEAAKKGKVTALANYYLRPLPQLNTVGSLGPGVTTKGQTQAETVLSQLSGIKLNEAQFKKWRTDEVYNRIDALERKRRDAKALGHDGRAKQIGKQQYALRKRYGLVKSTAKPGIYGSGVGGSATGGGNFYGKP